MRTPRHPYTALLIAMRARSSAAARRAHAVRSRTGARRRRAGLRLRLRAALSPLDGALRRRAPALLECRLRGARSHAIIR